MCFGVLAHRWAAGVFLSVAPKLARAVEPDSPYGLGQIVRSSEGVPEERAAPLAADAQLPGAAAVRKNL